MPRQDFTATLFSMSADATAVGNTTTETIIVPDFVFPAYTFIQGSKIRAQFAGRISNVVTAVPTITFRVRVGTATLSATAVFATAALATRATVATNETFWGDYTLTCRSSGTAGTIMSIGNFNIPNLTGGTTTNIINVMLPATAPATQNIDTTVANVLSLSAQWSAASASNTIQVHEYMLVSCN